MTPSILAWSLATPLALMIAGGDGQTDTADPVPPSALERALTERTCIGRPSAAAADADARQRCVDAQLTLLREDFGRDLRRLSAAERTGLDAACSRFETTHGRETYLDCVNKQLDAMRLRRTRAAVSRDAPAVGTGSAPEAAAPDAQTATTAAPPQSSPAADTSAAAGLSPRSTALAAAVLLGIAAIAAGTLVALTAMPP